MSSAYSPRTEAGIRVTSDAPGSCQARPDSIRSMGSGRIRIRPWSRSIVDVSILDPSPDQRLPAGFSWSASRIWSTLKLDGFWRGGYSRKVSTNWAT